ncbi:hypothetical protein KCH_08700 [Kitasatospora cheerisanensis KCTC 2395]|uniref:Uncharacterized protein n=1 Tax=Kitasatospora cheerisanensis KCTC 2395 TaxID=1348663 RepID=A0A066Z556_9ACTN|nr:hypothetical protein KCH_08700 [Kitasatospora cheerisanensis KCTC 2395]
MIDTDSTRPILRGDRRKPRAGHRRRMQVPGHDHPNTVCTPSFNDGPTS